MNKKDNHIVKSTPYAIEYYVHNASRGSDACRAAKGSDTSDPAAKAAVKRARADELLARLNKKLRITTEEKKRLELQTKMLLLLPKCSPQQPAPAACPLPAAATLARQGACQVLDAVRLSSLGGPPTKYRQPESSFPFKHLRTSSASALVAVEPSGTEEEARRSVRQQRFGEAVTKEQKGLQEASSASRGILKSLSGGFLLRSFRRYPPYSLSTFHLDGPSVSGGGRPPPFASCRDEAYRLR